MAAKYALFPGHVTSKRDGDWHHVDARQLAWLYNVPPRECVVVRETLNPREREILLEHIKRQGLIELRPRYDGNYSIPKEPTK